MSYLYDDDAMMVAPKPVIDQLLDWMRGHDTATLIIIGVLLAYIVGDIVWHLINDGSLVRK